MPRHKRSRRRGRRGGGRGLRQGAVRHEHAVAAAVGAQGEIGECGRRIAAGGVERPELGGHGGAQQQRAGRRQRDRGEARAVRREAARRGRIGTGVQQPRRDEARHGLGRQRGGQFGQGAGQQRHAVGQQQHRLALRARQVERALHRRAGRLVLFGRRDQAAAQRGELSAQVGWRGLGRQAAAGQSGQQHGAERRRGGRTATGSSGLAGSRGGRRGSPAGPAPSRRRRGGAPPALSRDATYPRSGRLIGGRVAPRRCADSRRGGRDLSSRGTSAEAGALRTGGERPRDPAPPRRRGRLPPDQRGADKFGSLGWRRADGLRAATRPAQRGARSASTRVPDRHGVRPLRTGRLPPRSLAAGRTLQEGRGVAPASPPATGARAR